MEAGWRPDSVLETRAALLVALLMGMDQWHMLLTLLPMNIIGCRI
jgi:hypothetical protein